MPYAPEPVESARKRMPAALHDVYDPLEVEAGKQTRPGLLRKHVFDFEDGMRMIVSRETMDGKLWIHASFSWFAPPPVLEIAESRIEERLRQAVGYTGFMQLVMRFATPKGILHLLMDPDRVDSSP